MVERVWASGPLHTPLPLPHPSLLHLLTLSLLGASLMISFPQGRLLRLQDSVLNVLLAHIYLPFRILQSGN